MKELLRSRRGRINVYASILVLFCACAYLAYMAWFNRTAMFHDITVELGLESLSIREFMNPEAVGSQVDFVTDYRKVDLGKTGQTEIILSHGTREETVLLTVQDTIAPTAIIETHRTVDIDQIPQAGELVSNVSDASAVRIYYAQEPVVSVDYSDVTVTVVIEDESGNKLEQDCVFSYRWLRDNIVLELGETLTPEMVLLNPQRDNALLDPAELIRVNNGHVGEYTITSVLGEREDICKVTVRDTRGPVLELKEVCVHPGSNVKLEDYIVSVSDASGNVELRLVGEAPDNSVSGRHTVIIEAEDKYGNVTRKETMLLIGEDIVPPVISGVQNSLTIEKYTEPDFMEGVSAFDGRDGVVEVTVDTGKLDNTAAGTYFITYTARDASGNTASVKRQVEVLHDEEDTAALVREIADSLPDDPRAIREFLRKYIGYSTSWGGEDPVWFGLNKNGGNCYVHALCLQTLLEYKGYETQLIWSTDKTHYWVLVKVREGWRHLDSTPSPQHDMIVLVTDEVRKKYLDGRVWDFENWPACD